MADEQINDDFRMLDISDDDRQNITIRCVHLKFKKLAKSRHPDKPGGTNEDFKALIGAYRRLIKHLEGGLSNESDDIEDDVHYEKEFFMRSNFPKQNQNCFTVILQNELATEWEKVLSTNHGDGQQLTNGGIKYSSGKVSITLYKKPKSDKKTKIHVQSGSQEENCEYVFGVLPGLFKLVSVLNNENVPEIEKKTPKKRPARNINYHESPVLKWLKNCQKYTCDECDYSTSKKLILKSHIKKRHIKSNPPAQVLGFKCLSDDFAISKKRKIEEHMGTHHATTDVEEVVEIAYTCGFCKLEFKETENFEVHLEAHEKFKCEVCNFTAGTESEVTIHNSANHPPMESTSCTNCEFDGNTKELY